MRKPEATSQPAARVLHDDVFRTMVNESVDGLVVIDADGIVRFANPAAVAFFAGRTADLVGFHLGCPAIRGPVELLLPRGGETLHVEMRSSEIQWEDRTASLASLRDITTQKRIQHALRERVKELRCLFELSQIVEREGGSIEELLEHAVRLLPPAWQFEESTVARITFHNLVFETADLAACTARMSTELVCDGEVAGAVEVGYRDEYPPAAEGPFLQEERDLLEMVAKRLGHVVGRRRSAKALRESEQRYRWLADNTLDVIWALNQDLEFTYVNPAITRLTGHTPEEFVGTRLSDHFAEAAYAELTKVIEREIAKGPAQAGLIYETELLHKDGSPVPVEVHGQVLFDDHGVPLGFQGTSRDLAERKRAEAERERLLLAIEHVAEAIIITDTDGTIQYVNPAFEQATGYSRPEALGKNPRLLKSGEHDAAFYQRLWSTLTGGHTWQGRLTNKRKDGTRYTAEGAISPVRGKDGRILNYVSAMRDITEQLELEHQLRQAQKMESVGRLAGGIAHDFNNMLSVILGNAELALEGLEPSAPLHVELQEIFQAGHRSADLTRQLLAFARKQTIAPKVLDLNDTIASMLKMLGRMIGEDIRLQWRPGANLWPIKMDPGQLDQVLANLVVNARDAISGVGHLTIETGKVELDANYCARHPGSVPGEYVMLSVSDDGSGMDGETLTHVFEPFFTTKPPGGGTGLGLSTVYGIVKQNEGYISVQSALGEGTTFKIYLPHLAGNEGCLDNERDAVAPRTGTETVLLVEYEAPLLELTARLLKRLGYTVLAAGSPGEALEVGRDYPGRIHLLVTDVVMPEMSGRDLWSKLANLRHDLQCLFMSGYTADAIAHRGVLDRDIRFLQKPFTVQTLAAKVREALGD